MLLRLQKFDLKVAYSKGTEMHIADPLSRAYLPSTNLDEEVKEDVWRVNNTRSPTEVGGRVCEYDRVCAIR